MRLKELIEEKKISQARLSRMADLSMNTIQVLYHDPYHDVMLSTIEKLAKALGVELGELVVIEDASSHQSRREGGS